MNKSNKTTSVSDLTDISETLLVPLYFRAVETLEGGIIQDHAAVKIINQLDYDFSRMKNDRDTQLAITLRTSIIDRIARDYIGKTSHPVIVNLGAGLDTRQLRYNTAKWYHLDLEVPMHLRKTFFEDSSINITKSILDFSWINFIEEKNNVLFIIEGVLMYLDEEKVKSIFEIIASHFRDSFIVFDMVPFSFTSLAIHQSIDLSQAPFKWGNDQLEEIEQWGYGFTSVSNYSYFSEYHNNKQLMKDDYYCSPKLDIGLKVGLIKTIL